MPSPYEAELTLAKSAALKAGEIIRSYSNNGESGGGAGGGRSNNSATVCVKSVSEQNNCCNIIKSYRLSSQTQIIYYSYTI